MDDTNSFDPFAVLRAIEHGHSDQADALFTGSEPVPAAAPDPAPAEPAPAAAPVAETPAPAVAPAAQLAVSQLETVVRDALLDLEMRIAAIELLAKRNGWPL